MTTLRLVHRWLGGLFGLVLAMLGATGTLLLYREPWLRWTVPHGGDPVRGADTAATVAALFDGRYGEPATAVLASDELGVHRLIYPGGGGAYVDQAGAVVLRWSDEWQRPDLFLLDLHRHLLSGPNGEVVVGLAGLLGLVFVVSGAILWWQTRRTFAPRPLPRRWSRPAVVRHHRDLGILVAPLLVVSFVTGAMMALKPVEATLLAPFGPAGSLAAFRAKPTVPPGAARATPADWRRMIDEARRRVPGATVRVVSYPAKPQTPITLRLRTADDWLPSGSTMLSFAPDDGRLLAVRRPEGAAPSLASKEFPLHAAKVGGWLWRICLTLSGLALTMLGSLAVVMFWRQLLPPKSGAGLTPIVVGGPATR